MQRLFTVSRYSAFSRALVFAAMFTFSAVYALAAGRIVGKVTDDDTKAALGGVSIKIKVGSKVMGAFTSKDGSYEIRNVPAGSYDVAASYIGFKSQSKKVTVSDDADVTANFNMQLDLLLLEEAVVIGYGTKQKKDITSSQARVEAKDITNLPVPSVDQALQGKATGVQIITASGMPGAPVTVRIRGAGSIASATEPLYVIDGIPISSGDFSSQGGIRGEAGRGYGSNSLIDLNPQDIESIDVLKDAAATAIYGARGANGVVLITTKRGQAGTTKFNVSLTTGFSNPARTVEVLNRDEFVQLYTEAWNNDIRRGLIRQGTPIQWPVPGNINFNINDSRNNTDWMSLVFRTGRLNEANVSASGGSEKTKFYTGIAYRNETGFTIGNSFERINGRLNLDHQATEALTLSANVAVTRTVQKQFPEAWGGGLGWAQTGALPIFPVTNPDGTYFRPLDFWVNPIARAENIDLGQTALRTLAGLSAELKILPELSFRSEGSVDLYNMQEDLYINGAIRGDRNPYAEQRRVQVVNWNVNNYFNFNTKVDAHDIQATVGFQAQRSDQNDNGVRGTQGSANPYLRFPGNFVLPLGYTVYNNYSFLSYFARLGYKFQDKYLLNASVNYNGSSRFGPNRQFGLFPGVSLGWIVSQEDFLKGNETLTYLKLRGSYGLTGNAEIGNYVWRALFAPQDNYDGRAAIVPSQVPNNDLTWERSAQLDVGLEYALWDGRIQGGFGYYNRSSTDMLLPLSVATSTGFGTVLQNVGSITNSGFEFNITTYNLTGDFQWQTDLNASFNRNVINDLGGLQDGVVGGQGETRAIAGYPVGTFFMNTFDKINDKDQQVPVTRRRVGNTITWSDLRRNPQDPRATQFYDTTVFVRGGEPLFKDLNGKTTDRYTVADRQPQGQPYPVVFGGLTNTFRYKGFELSLVFNYAFGNYVYDDAAKWAAGGTFGALGGWNQRREVTLRRWQKDGDVTDVPALTTRSIYNDLNTTRHLYRADFVRLRTASLAYNLPSELCSSLGLNSIRVSVTGFNLLTFTQFPYWDPEVVRDTPDGAQDRNFSQGVTFLAPPQARSVNIGLNIGF